MVGSSGALLVGGGILGTACAAWSLFWWYEGEKCEKPKYTVRQVLLGSSSKFRLRKYNEIELRDYSPYVIAEATIVGSMGKGMREGFMTVAKCALNIYQNFANVDHVCRYIFGANTKKDSEESQKVAMTSPVRMEMPSESIAMTSPVQIQESGTSSNGAEEQTYKVSFVMPSEYTLETLPVPKNTELELKEVPAHAMVAYTYFGGLPSAKKVAKSAEYLKAKAEEAGIKVKGTPSVYQYHPPFAPSFLRRVEILYAVE